MLIPGTQLAIANDKRGRAYVVNKNNMGGEVTNDTQIVQKFQSTTRGMWGGAAYYRTGSTTGIYYLWGTGDRLKAYKFNGTKFELPPRTNAATLIGYPGGQLSVSSDETVAGSAILWAVRPKRTTPGLASSGGPGVLTAFNAADVTQTLYSSETIPADALGAISKFAPPTIANGRVYVGTANQLAIYGLRAGNPLPVPDAGAPDAADSGVAVDASGPAPTWTQLYAQYFGPNTPGHCSGTGGCHTNIRGGFKCGTTKATCYTGLLQAGLITPGAATGAQSPLGIVGQSPLAWFGGGMPLDNDAPNPQAAAAVKAWLTAGAQND
jgi:hypothetical protein